MVASSNSNAVDVVTVVPVILFADTDNTTILESNNIRLLGITDLLGIAGHPYCLDILISAILTICANLICETKLCFDSKID